MRSKVGSRIFKSKCSVVTIFSALLALWAVLFTAILKVIKYQDQLYYINLENKLIDEGYIDTEEQLTIKRQLEHDPA